MLVICGNLIIHQSKQPLNTFSVKSGCFFTFLGRRLMRQPLFCYFKKSNVLIWYSTSFTILKIYVKIV